MQNPETGEFKKGTKDELRTLRDELIEGQSPEADPFRDERDFPIFEIGKLVEVSNQNGESAVGVVETIGRKFIRIRGVPRSVLEAKVREQGGDPAVEDCQDIARKLIDPDPEPEGPTDAQ